MKPLRRKTRRFVRAETSSFVFCHQYNMNTKLTSRLLTFILFLLSLSQSRFHWQLEFPVVIPAFAITYHCIMNRLIQIQMKCFYLNLDSAAGGCMTARGLTHSLVKKLKDNMAVTQWLDEFYLHDQSNFLLHLSICFTCILHSDEYVHRERSRP